MVKKPTVTVTKDPLSRGNPKTIPLRPGYARVKEAREALQRKAEKWADAYDQLIEKAVKKGDTEAGTKAIQWAFEHMPADDGVTVIDRGVDKDTPKLEGNTGPVIKIGFALGGLTPVKALPAAPAEVIEVPPEPTETPVEPEKKSDA